MSITDDIDASVFSIRHALDSIRNSDIDTSDIDSYLDTIESEYDELAKLEEDDPDILVSDALDDMGLGDFGEQWNHIDVGTANQLPTGVNTREFEVTQAHS